EGLELAEVAIGAAYDERWEALKVEGRFTTGDPLAVTLGGRGGGDGEGRRLAVRTDNAGAFLRALDLFDTVEGGTLNLSADVVDAAGHPVRGLLQIDDFRVVRAPVLTRLLTLASLTGIAEVLRGQGISFTRFRAPFELAGDRITTTHARAVGPAIGVTVAGTIDRATDVADLAGTMVPAYTINSILGSIPILGSILGGKEGEGVIGLTYRIAGPRSDPEITVNPLSALAPGVLRDLVTSLERGAGQASEPRPDGGFEPPGRQ
ncbi:MAG: hypothetical protein FJX56_09830, partial [Alphaproteobacteria bacterium]|nr:hypothetical protein [Alphaproteobacteria bacterium]